MKKILFLCTVLLTTVGIQLNAQSQLCMPELKWGTYACISKVEINGMVHTSTIPTEEYAYGIEHEDFTSDSNSEITLEAGKEYTLNITVTNFGSGLGDLYYLTTYFDWNGDNVLDESEELYQKSFAVGKPGPNANKVFTETINVPADAHNGTMRVYLHYKTPDVPYTDACCKQDSGQLEDYKFVIGTDGIADTANETFSIYPNPTSDYIHIEWEGATNYVLFNSNGVALQKGALANQTIFVGNHPAGLYILEVQTPWGRKHANVIIK
jgi:hypothetical protein